MPSLGLALGSGFAIGGAAGQPDPPFPPEPPVPHDTHYAAEGDSITAGSVGPTTPYTQLSYDDISTPSDLFHNYATSGSYMVDLRARKATVLASFDATKLNIISVLIGVNDFIARGAFTNSFFQELKDYCNEFKAAGWKVIICTLLPAVSNATYETQRLATNTSIRNDSSFYDGLADLAANSIMGQFTSVLDPTYYIDTLHPTQAGMAVLQSVFEPVLTAIFAANVNPVVAQPSVSIQGGAYPSSQTVTLSCTTPGVRFKYTLDGSVPTQLHGTRYFDPISIPSSALLRVIAYKYAYFDSVVTDANYLIEASGSRPNLGTPSIVLDMFGSAAASVFNRAPQFGGVSNGNAIVYGFPPFDSKAATLQWNQFLQTMLVQKPQLTWLLIGQWDVNVNDIPLGNYTGVGGDNGLTLYTGGGGFNMNGGNAGSGSAGATVDASMNGAKWNAAFLTADTSSIKVYCPVVSTSTPEINVSGTVEIPTRRMRIGSGFFPTQDVAFPGPETFCFFAAWDSVQSTAQIAAYTSSLITYLALRGITLEHA